MGFLGTVKRTLRRAYYGSVKAMVYLAPVKKNKIVFINFNGKGYGCNPKYIAEEIMRQDLNFDMVWLAEDVTTPLPSAIRAVPYFGKFRPYYELATAKIIITNVKNDLRLHKKASQYIIQTWHGSYSAKKLEAAAASTLSPSYVRESIHNSAQTDLFLSNGRVCSDNYRRDFWCDCEIMTSGFPRNDPLFHLDSAVPGKVKQWFGIDPATRIALYAPTFRDDGSTDAYDLDPTRTIEALTTEHSSWVLLIRMHPNVADKGTTFTYTDRVLDATAYPDMQELLQACDALITDYSSSIYETALMGKGVYIYATDLEQYDAARGLVPEFWHMPYPINTTQAMLEETILADTPDRMAENARAFLDMLGCVDDGHASERVVQRIRDVMEK